MLAEVSCRMPTYVKPKNPKKQKAGFARAAKSHAAGANVDEAQSDGDASRTQPAHLRMRTPPSPHPLALASARRNFALANTSRAGVAIGKLAA